MNDLQERAQAFLQQPIPAEIDYVPDSIAELFIRNYAVGGQFDAEFVEMGELAAEVMKDAIAHHTTPEAKAYFQECKEILEAILAYIIENKQVIEDDDYPIFQVVVDEVGGNPAKVFSILRQVMHLSPAEAKELLHTRRFEVVRGPRMEVEPVQEQLQRVGAKIQLTSIEIE